MLNRAFLDNFTVFSNEEITFSPQINLIVGENGSGKSLLMKSLYSLMAASWWGRLQAPTVNDPWLPSKSYLQKAIANKIIGVFKPDSLGRLVSRIQGSGQCKIRLEFEDAGYDMAIWFSSHSKTEVGIEQAPKKWLDQPPLFLPTRELLTIYPGFVSFYEKRHIAFEETWRDTCSLLGDPLSVGTRKQEKAALLKPIEAAMGGKIVTDKSGRFYLKCPGQGTLEMYLVAEGVRKLGMVARLIANEALLNRGFLFWDEPEANLNPKLIRVVAEVIHQLGQLGIQIFLGTHSFFLLNELNLLNRSSGVKAKMRFIGLDLKENQVHLQQVETLNELDFVTLSEELAQFNREMALG